MVVPLVLLVLELVLELAFESAVSVSELLSVLSIMRIGEVCRLRTEESRGFSSRSV